jgi:hypothetical protein
VATTCAVCLPAIRLATQLPGHLAVRSAHFSVPGCLPACLPACPWLALQADGGAELGRFTPPVLGSKRRAGPHCGETSCSLIAGVVRLPAGSAAGMGGARVLQWQGLLLQETRHAAGIGCRCLDLQLFWGNQQRAVLTLPRVELLCCS